MECRENKLLITQWRVKSKTTKTKDLFCDDDYSLESEIEIKWVSNINNRKFKDIDDLDDKIETYLKQLLGIVWQRKKLESDN